MNSSIRIAAAVIRDRHDRILLVRKRGTTAFMQPGGKIHPNEDALGALARELHEELGCSIRPATARFLGRFAAPAANEVGATVIADLYHVEVHGEAIPGAEIEEVAWVDAAAPGDYTLAPLTRDAILPLLTDPSGVQTGQKCRAIDHLAAIAAFASALSANGDFGSNGPRGDVR